MVLRLVKKPVSNKQKSKMVILTDDHFRFFKTCIDKRSASHFIRKLIDNSDEFKKFIEQEELEQEFDDI